jgi:hypothetical protein
MTLPVLDVVTFVKLNLIRVESELSVDETGKKITKSIGL